MAWRIRHKLMLGLGLVAAVMALLLTGTLKGLFSYRATMRTFTSKFDELKEAENLLAQVRALGQRSPKVEEFANRIAAAREALSEYQKKLLETIALRRDPHNGFKEREQVRALEERFDRLHKAFDEALKPAVDELLWWERKSVKDAIDDLAVASLGLNEIIYGDLKDRVEVAKSDYKLSMVIVISTTVLGVLLMVGLLRWFYRWVFFPIRDLNQGVERVARGDFEHGIEVKSGDEIEDLARAFNDMRGRLREMYGELAQKVNERSRQLVRSERLAGVGFLAAGVAHEINNPLAGIAFCSEALDSRLADLLAPRRTAPIAADDREIIAKYLRMIQEEAFRCKEIIQRLLDFSRGGERRREATDLAEVIQSVLDMVQHLPNSKGKDIRYDMLDGMVPWVNAQEIKSVVLNLVVNALDSMDEGGRLTIMQRSHDGMAELVFQDTGCGMTPEILENIFEPFFSRSRTGKGTGLGLSISHRIISQHGGEIEATSEGPGKGSQFVVRLPLTAPANQPEGNGEVLDPETEFGKLAGKPQRRAA